MSSSPPDEEYCDTCVPPVMLRGGALTIWRGLRNGRAPAPATPYIPGAPLCLYEGPVVERCASCTGNGAMAEKRHRRGCTHAPATAGPTDTDAGRNWKPGVCTRDYVADDIRACASCEYRAEIAPCIHRGPATGEVRAGGTNPLNVLHLCRVHGACTITQQVAGAGFCGACTDRVPTPPADRTPITTRHLLYHLYPVSGNGAWEWNVDELCMRLDLFNGRVVVAVVTDPPAGRGPDPLGADANRHFAPCDSLAAVRARFGPHAARVEFLAMENDPQLREVKSFPELFGRIPDEPGHATLYAHGKGTTRPVGDVARTWTAALYTLYMDYWAAVAECLDRCPIAGAFRKIGRGWGAESASEWHYSGAWTWFRNRELFARKWQRIGRWWGGIESYFSEHFTAAEGGLIFCTGDVREVNLYSSSYWQHTATPALDAWKRENANRRTDLAAALPRQLNYGCGPHYFPGWLNTDIVRTAVINPDLVTTPGAMLPFPTGHFERAYCGHVLEHIPWADVPAAIAEIARTVRPGGEIAVVGPDFSKALDELRAEPNSRHKLERVWEITEDHSHYQRESLDVADWGGARHQWNCYDERVVWAMERAGLADVRIVPLEPGVMGGWPVVDYSNRAQCAVIGRVP